MYTPSEKELHECPRIIMSSPYEWNPDTVQLHYHTRQFEDEMTQHYNISDIQRQNIDPDYTNDIMFNIGQIIN